MSEHWTTDRIREAFIDDGGQADYYDPINGAKEQRRVAGDIFDRWLAAHDAQVLRDLAAKILPAEHAGTPMRRERYVREDVADEILHEANRIEEEQG